MNFLPFFILCSYCHTNCSRASLAFGVASGEFKKRLSNLRFLLARAKFALHAKCMSFSKVDTGADPFRENTFRTNRVKFFTPSFKKEIQHFAARSSVVIVGFMVAMLRYRKDKPEITAHRECEVTISSELLPIGITLITGTKDRKAES
jgi:hypothetical protein